MVFGFQVSASLIRVKPLQPSDPFFQCGHTAFGVSPPPLTRNGKRIPIYLNQPLGRESLDEHTQFLWLTRDLRIFGEPTDNVSI